MSGFLTRCALIGILLVPTGATRPATAQIARSVPLADRGFASPSQHLDACRPAAAAGLVSHRDLFSRILAAA